MRIACTQPDLVTDKFIQSPKETILAGRYLASRCTYDITKKKFGLESFRDTQNSFDRDYPDQYKIEVYHYKRNGGDCELVYTGDKTFNHVVRIIRVYNFVINAFDFFGLIGSIEDFLESNRP